ncbi:MAG: hypothetical protein LBO63_01600 [Oscillospiraceae bacterium]|jgi:formate C-acetyltransferase|nr:hypothetical protein [Oscillospiraceae bacterium]
MHTFKPVTPRVEKMREKYRETLPELCLARYRLITEFYKENTDIIGILKRAKCFRHICENIPVRIDDDEIIVGAQSGKFKAAALYPENGIEWLISEAKTGLISTRKLDPYIMSDEDRDYFLETADFWTNENMGAKFRAYMPEAYKPYMGNPATFVGFRGSGTGPVGHFCTGYHNAIKKGFAAIKAEADAHVKEYEDAGLPTGTLEKYNFYRSISIVTEGMITLTKRYAALAEELAAAETRPGRKAELEMMADTLNHTMDKPARSFLDAVQCIYMYQTCLCLDSNLHGISFGRIDQYLGDYYTADVESGKLTPEFAQELMDLFYIKVAEMNKPWDAIGTEANPGYTSGQLMTLGGVKADGTDASNPVSYMMLQTCGRLYLHSPPQALRIHKGTPPELWEAAIETTKRCGGVPTFENDDVIIPALMDRGLSLTSARNYCLIGCVEPGGCGDEWPACGGDGNDSYWNIVGAFMLALNNGRNPMSFGGGPGWDDGPETDCVAPQTGYFYNMKTFDELLAAFKTQVEFFVRWHVVATNLFEYVAREYLPLPVVSATMDGCMESGRDVMYGGARYNSTGISGVGIGNVGDSLQMIKHLVYDTKKCTARELYDAIKHNWAGYEELRDYIKNSAPHYGNGNAEVDKWTAWAAGVFSDAVNSHTGPRGRYSAGLYPVTTNIAFGKMTPATPDGRSAHEPLADGISPVQQMDVNGPTNVLLSVSQINQRNYPNGTLLNMKFHPTSLSGQDSIAKLSDLLQTYFRLGGMEVQINVINSDVMKSAQDKPGEFKNLVVRVAGFSTYFIELHTDAQNDLIRRTELQLG